MGGNLVTKMAGECGEAVPSLCAGLLAVCPALDLGACADALERRNNYFYQRRFVLGLNARYARKVELFPERYSRNGFAPIRTVREFDDCHHRAAIWLSRCPGILRSAGAKCVIDKVRVAATPNYSEGRSVRAVRSDSHQWRGEKSRDRDRCSETWRALRVYFE